jgi:glycosyltransferase involved in cell wall biosynthesis
MYQTTRELARLCRLHVIALLDYPHERDAHAELAGDCASMELQVRRAGTVKSFGSVTPNAVLELTGEDLEWLIHRQIYTQRIDAVQLEYTNMGIFGGAFRQIPNILFEHDIYFQSIARQLGQPRGIVWKTAAAYEYLRALRYERRMLPRMDRVQVCSPANGEFLTSYVPSLRGRIDPDLRAGIDTASYEFRPEGREPRTMLFVGGFRHLPNQEAMTWFTREVLPGVLKHEPEAKLVIVGSDPPPRHAFPPLGAIELRGFVEDVREPLNRYAVFVCPILSGSGMRVKLLEAFAAGIPAVSTRVGAEGLADKDGEFCGLADDPAAFAAAIVRLFHHPEEAGAMATRARALVENKFDMRVMTDRLMHSYRAAVAEKRRKDRNA